MVDASNPTADPARIPQTYTDVPRVNAPDWKTAPATTSPNAKRLLPRGPRRRRSAEVLDPAVLSAPRHAPPPPPQRSPLPAAPTRRPTFRTNLLAAYTAPGRTTERQQ